MCKALSFNRWYSGIAPGKMKDLFDVKSAFGIALLYSGVVLVNRLNEGVIWAPDTPQYIEKSVIRPPLYPLLINVFTALFDAYGFIALICFQVLFVLLSAFYLSHILLKKFHVHPVVFVLLYIFLSLPLLSISVAVGIHGGIGNRLLTEAVSYGFFLFAVSYLVKTLFGDERRNFFIFLLLIAILTLIRTPMLFLYGVAGCLIIYLHSRTKNIKRTLGLVLLLVAVFLTADLGERFYHRVVNNYWGKINRDASHLLVGAVYTSDKRVLIWIADPRDREVLRRSYDVLEDKKLLSKNRFEIDRRLVDIYNDHFVPMQTVLLRSFQDVFPMDENRDRSMREDDMYIQFESFSRRVAPVLVFHNYQEFFKLMLLKFLYTFNFREGVFLALFLLFPFVRLSPEFKMTAFFVLLMLLLNRLVMTPIIFIGDRYLLYTDILEYAVMVTMADQYLRHVFGGSVLPGWMGFTPKDSRG